MVMNTIRMNQSDADECPIIDEETNIDATMLFDLFKDW